LNWWPVHSSSSAYYAQIMFRHPRFDVLMPETVRCNTGSVISRGARHLRNPCQLRQRSRITAIENFARHGQHPVAPARIVRCSNLCATVRCAGATEVAGLRRRFWCTVSQVRETL
jgi:hypothetical protein